MCTYTFTFDDKLVERVRPAFRDDSAISEWLQSKIEGLFRQVAKKMDKKQNADSANERIFQISSLKANWDGHGAVKIPKKVINNCLSFVNELNKIKVKIDSQDIVPTPYGTIDVDITTKRGVISFEIGSSQLGYFTEFEGVEDCHSDGIDTDFKAIPDEVRNVLNL